MRVFGIWDGVLFSGFARVAGGQKTLDFAFASIQPTRTGASRQKRNLDYGQSWGSRMTEHVEASFEDEEFEFYRDLGKEKFNLGQFSDSIKDFDEAVRLRPDNADVLTNRGWAKYKVGRYKEAVKDFDGALLLKPDNAEAHNGRKKACEASRQHEDIIDDFFAEDKNFAQLQLFDEQLKLFDG